MMCSGNVNMKNLDKVYQGPDNQTYFKFRGEEGPRKLNYLGQADAKGAEGVEVNKRVLGDPEPQQETAQQQKQSQTQVPVSDVTAPSAAADQDEMNRQRRRRGQGANALSTDRNSGTILGGSSGATSAYMSTRG